MGHLLRRAVVGDPAFVQDQDGIVELQVRQRVRHRQHDPALAAGKVVEQSHDLALRTRVEAAGDLVAKQQLGVRDQLHRQPQPALLAAGKHLHLAVGDRRQPGFLKHPVDPLVEFFQVTDLHPQPGRGLDRLVHRQRIIGDGELRDVADFRGIQVAFLREVPAFPHQRPARLRVQAGDGLEQRGLAAARRADDRHEVTARDREVDLIDEVYGLAVFLNGEADVLEFEHGGWGE